LIRAIRRDLLFDSIIENSPAHKAEIECGMLITKINEKRTADMSREELERLTLPEVKTVTFMKNGALKAVNFLFL
jgi:C-terminal processing protease CtpA/Prc